MRILLAAPGMQVGGAERIVVTLAAGLAQRGHEVAVAGPGGPLDAELGVGPRVVWPERGRSPAGVAIGAARLARFVRAWRPHVVHAHNPKLATTAGLATRVARGPRRPPLLATVHGLKPSELEPAARLLRATSDRVVCVSEDLASALAERGLAAEIVHNAVEPLAPLSPAVRAALDAELGLNGGPLVATVGRLAEPKNHDRLLAAAAHVLRAEPAARFLVVGDGPRRAALERRAGELGIAARVRFTGPRPDARALIARSDVLAISSDWEGLSLAALEALAAGVPVVSTPVPGMRLLLGTGAGVVTDGWSASALGDAVLELLADRERRTAMGATGRALADERFGVERMLDGYERVYAALVRTPPTLPTCS